MGREKKGREENRKEGKRREEKRREGKIREVHHLPYAKNVVRDRFGEGHWGPFRDRADESVSPSVRVKWDTMADGRFRRGGGGGVSRSRGW